jgi:hypothetical protein
MTDESAECNGEGSWSVSVRATSALAAWTICRAKGAMLVNRRTNKMIGVCFACGKPLPVNYEALCSEACREEYKIRLADLKAAVKHPATLRGCARSLEIVEALPLAKGELGELRRMHQVNVGDVSGGSFCIYCGLPFIDELWRKYECSEEWKKYHRVYQIGDAVCG